MPEADKFPQLCKEPGCKGQVVYEPQVVPGAAMKVPTVVTVYLSCNAQPSHQYPYRVARR